MLKHYCVTSADGYYGDEAYVLSVHATEQAARRACGASPSVQILHSEAGFRKGQKLYRVNISEVYTCIPA